MIKSYEDWGFSSLRPPASQPLVEALDPARMVAWYNRITQEFQKRLEQEEGVGGNKQSAQKLRTLLNTWTNPKFAINSSLNVEAFDGLAAACEQYAKADYDWKHHSFVAELYNNLEQAIAKIESSGMVGNGQEEQPDLGGGGAPSTDFGPQDEPPPGGDQPPEPGAEEPPPGSAEAPEDENQPGARKVPAPQGI